MRKKSVLGLLLLALTLSIISCAKGISTYDAAHGKARCGKYIR